MAIKDSVHKGHHWTASEGRCSHRQPCSRYYSELLSIAFSESEFPEIPILIQRAYLLTECRYVLPVRVDLIRLFQMG